MAESIDELIARMDRRLERAVETNHASGYFAAVYRAVTARVRDGIEAGEFDDGERMERFDVTFAGLYLDAAAAYEAGGSLPQSWRVAFEQEDRPLLVLQHVLLGMNAHINFDLGIAAARSAPDAAITELRDDFVRINDVLADMIDRMQAAVASVSPWTRLVDRVGLRMDEAVTNWSLEYARDRAWRFAESLATTQPGGEVVRARDVSVARLGRAIARPGRLTRSAIALVRQRERSDVGVIVGALRDRDAPLPV